MENESFYEIESFGYGYIVADYSGNRGKLGAAYCGQDKVWRSQPLGMTPFDTKEDAQKWIDVCDC